jgi:hypothetical protein
MCSGGEEGDEDRDMRRTVRRGMQEREAGDGRTDIWVSFVANPLPLEIVVIVTVSRIRCEDIYPSELLLHTTHRSHS